MFKLMFDKSFWVAGAFCALAMNINTALGINVSKWELFSLNETYMEIKEKIGPLYPRVVTNMKRITEQLCPCSDDKEDIISTFFLICLGLNEIELKKLSAEDRKDLFKQIKQFNPKTLLKPSRKKPRPMSCEDEEAWYALNTLSGETYELTVYQGLQLRLLSIVLKYTSSVIGIKVYYCYALVGDREIEDLSEALKVNSSLVSLVLFYYPKTKDLSEALKVNSSLMSLSLCGCFVGDAGAKNLADALKVNNSLTELDLSLNDIGDDGAESLSKALKLNRSLTELNLEDNKIGAPGIKSLAQGLETNATVTNLHL